MDDNLHSPQRRLIELRIEHADLNSLIDTLDSGKNRIVRRIFAALGYDVKTLDRVMYAGLTKKNVPRGKWRLLTDKEIRVLKYLKS